MGIPRSTESDEVVILNRQGQELPTSSLQTYRLSAVRKFHYRQRPCLYSLQPTNSSGAFLRKQTFPPEK